MSPIANEHPGPQRSDAKYLAVVGGLLLLITASMAVLWMNERHRRREAERQLLERPPRLKGIEDALADAVFASGGSRVTVRPVQREDLPTQMVNLDGRARQALLLSAKAGQRFGFRGGDVVIIAPEPPGTGGTKPGK